MRLLEHEDMQFDEKEISPEVQWEREVAEKNRNANERHRKRKEDVSGVVLVIKM